MLIKMNTKKSSKPQRIDEDFLKDLRRAAAERVGRGLAKPIKEDISMREITRMGRTAPSYPKWIREISTFPKRRKQ